ncbi:TetR/AcrR family transcriptional regulator [Bacillus sp. SB49]|uniref:TetR/AcrR family transcriptional regulator n=1 Tax=Bacillus sp. SB49 TaxID=1071080 RepID=UPI000479E46B|nr:TetR/AcrR family transcriptional regulator [Bacillus sp. SB49]QHT48744.1 TetR/AcrR family transcriptional regulator [Bacillus sp. SB49]
MTHDRRVIRTKKLIREALAELIGEKGFHAVSVRDITTRAAINRGTFYLHYQDKFDLLEQCEKEVFEEIEAVAEKVDLQEMKHFLATNKPLPFIVSLLDYIKENAAFMHAVLGPNGDVSFQLAFKDFLKTNVGREVLQTAKEEDRLVPYDYLLSYLVSAHLGVIQEWLETGTKESPEEISVYIARLSLLGPFQAAGLAKGRK